MAEAPVRDLGSGIAFSGPASARVLGTALDLVDALDSAGCEVLLTPSDHEPAAVGYADALQSYLAGEPVLSAIDDPDEPLVFAYVADVVADVVCIAGRWVDADTAASALVALPTGGPSRPAPLLVSSYSDARDRHEWLRLAAPEIVELSFWTPEYCALLIDEVEARDAWGHDPDDPVPGDEVSLLDLSPRLFARFEADLASRVVPRLREVWPEFAWCGLHDAFVIRFAASAARGELALHHDVAQISGTVRLNHGYEGGAIEFPRQSFRTGGAPIGALTMWPSLVTHPHRSMPVTRGVKYDLTAWFALPQ